ncbi:LPD7 domain-containing protein [uncultured Tateyamaria sp.]|uniref:LPD7 domain-containing protein n=1 Tax=uncultured Tateyamaria sp. TaxID=455651 RepID=UPI002622E02F|nr:LPD7 domain-containing protein [uncultured Tateyamaria sp.]
MANDQDNYLSDGTDARHPRSRQEIEAQAEDQFATDVVKKRAEFEALVRRHRAMMDEQVQNTKSMFGRTPPEVSVNALALAVEEAHHLDELHVLEGKPRSTGGDIRDFNAQIRNRDVEYYSEGSKQPAFLDDGKNIYVPSFEDEAALLASLQLAQQRWGVVKVNGNDDFKARVVEMAVTHDLKLANVDLAEVVQMRREAGSVLSQPSVEERAAAEDFHASVEEKGPATPSAAPQPVQETVAAEPAQPARDVAATAETPSEDDDWIERLQAERRLRKEAKMDEQDMTPETDIDTTPAVDAPSIDFEEEPEVEIDLGFDDGDDWDPMATADPVPPSTQKQAVGARP